MSDEKSSARRRRSQAAGEPTADEVLTSLLGDLDELKHYLDGRAQHTYELAQRFVDNAQRNSANRAYDERQATMLEYQHYIWVEIATLVEKLRTRYTPPPTIDDRA
jgi:hypothetical protein